MADKANLAPILSGDDDKAKIKERNGIDFYDDVLNRITERNEGIRMASEILFELSQDKEVRIQYERELLACLKEDERILDTFEEGREEGIAIGEERGIGIGIGIGVDTTLRVINALKAQVPVDEIANVYKLSHEKIESIRSTLGL